MEQQVAAKYSSAWFVIFQISKYVRGKQNDHKGHQRIYVLSSLLQHSTNTRKTPQCIIQLSVSPSTCTSFTARGSYQAGSKPAAFLASVLKGGFRGPLKYSLTILWKV